MHDWDDAFNNMGPVKDSDALPGFWAARASAYREGPARVEVDLPYGDHDREKFDLIWPGMAPKGLIVFVHGGFWMRLDKSYWTDLAEGARANGWVVCIPSYTLTPDIRVSGITQQVAAAIEAAGRLVDGPIRLAGHSAGGHLVTRMLCLDSPLSAETLARVEKTITISGLHDLRPLLHTAMNDTLKLTEKEAVAESPALMRTSGPANVVVWVGGNERPEFIRQSRLLAVMWEGLDAHIKFKIDAGHNHFTILEGLKMPSSEICNALTKQDLAAAI